VGHRVQLTVGADAVDVSYVAELPERRVLEEARGATGAGYATRLLEGLRGEVKITWDGAPLPATPVAIAEPVKPGDGGFLEFTVGWRATLPGDHGRLGVRNGNYPEDPGFYATSITLDGRWVADATSLLSVKNGRVRDNWHGAWVKDERGREPWVDLRPAGFLERAAGPAPLPERMAGVTDDGPPPWLLAILALALVPIALLGRWLGRRAHRARRAE